MRRGPGTLPAILLAALAGGCAAPLQTTRLLQAPPQGLTPAVELAAVPFFPQEDFHCGPAALATVLTAAGQPVSPQALAAQVYLPGRQGSLQTEIIVAARRHGRVAYPLAPRLADLLREIEAGHPVLVLQNLGLDWHPQWHYAVIVGFDLERGTVLLRSGRRQRHEVALEVFERTWRRAERWALVVLPPERLPATARVGDYLAAAAALEQTGSHDAATRAYRSAAGRWPADPLPPTALGNALYALGRPSEAIDAYRTAIAADPDYAPAHNNLAYLLQRRGETRAARRHALRAVELGGPHAAEYRRTLREIEGADRATP